MSVAEAARKHALTVADIRERSEDVLFFTHYPMMKDAPGYHSSQAYQIGGVILSLIRHFAGANWMPHEIGIEQSVVAQGLQDLLPGTRLVGGQQVGYIAIPRSCLGARPPDPSEESGGGLGPLAGPLDYLGTLRALIKPYLSSGHLSEQMAAKLMDTSARTLRRRLSTHGTSYRAVLDEVRFRQAVSPEDARRHEADDLVRHLDASGALVLYVMGNDDLVELEPRWQRVQSLHGRRVEHGGFAFVGYQ